MHGSGTTPATWEPLLRAMREPAVEEKELADTIREEVQLQDL